ncbi:MAG: hypothetical protein V2I79_12275, partial [Xanthomonadales bacterium]|nr:hypothetical protein [Xanthomonadales bacterium]
MTNRPGMSLITVLAILLLTAPLALAREDVAAEYGFTAADNESYLPESVIAFVRPGLELEILDVVIPADMQTEVTFKLTDPAGLPLDRNGVMTPGPVSTSFILAYIPEGEEAYVAYTARVATSPITGDSAVQATSDSGGSYTDLGDGTYVYKFGTVLPDDYEAGATHSLGIYARRDLTEFDLDRYVTNEMEHWVPAGGTAMPRSIVTTATCNRCHDPLAIHGGARTDVPLCILCHNPTQSIDPDTGDSVDMPYMVHKIHAGAALENGYTIIGYRQSVHDYSDVHFPTALNDCEVCHTGGTPTEDFPLIANPSPAPSCDSTGRSMAELSWGDAGAIELRLDSPDGHKLTSRGEAGSFMTGAWLNDLMEFFLVETGTGDVIQSVTPGTTVFGCSNNPPGAFVGEPAVDHTAWMTSPSRVVCGSCHDDIDFEEGVGHPQMTTDETCSLCHQPTGREYGASVAGTHQVDYQSAQLGGVLVQVLDITNIGPGQRPIVTFSLSNKWGPLPPSMLGRLRFSLSGPNDDFSFYAQDDAIGALQADGANWKFQFETPLPDDAMGSYSLGVEGRINNYTLNPGTNDEFTMNDQMQNFIEPFAVTGDSVMPRRMVVDDAKCESCHANLSLHGSNRHDAGGYCQTCHMPSATDAVVRPEGEGAPESIDFRYMVHKIHRGAELENGYVVYGYRSTVHDYSDIHYVGDLRNCEACHVEGAYTLPLSDGLEMVTTPRDYFTPMGPETASCLSCHDSQSAASHALSNSSE